MAKIKLRQKLDGQKWTFPEIKEQEEQAISVGYYLIHKKYIPA
jgi:hypothetical protein